MTPSETSTRLLRNWRKEAVSAARLRRASAAPISSPPAAFSGIRTPMWRSPSRSISKGAISARRELRAGEGGGEGGLARSQGRDGQARRLAGRLDEKGDLAVGQPADLGGDRLVEAVPGDQHADELGPGLHGDRHRGEELVALAPQRRGVLALEGAAHDRVGREVVARGRGPVGPGHQHARGVGRHHEVGPEVLAALPERVEGRGLVALSQGGLEVGVVGEDPHAQLELVEAVRLDRLPDVAGLLEPGVDRGAREAVGLHGGEDEGAAHERDHEHGDEQQDLPGQSHGARRSSISTARRPRSPCRTCSCGAPASTSRRRA